MSGEWCARSNSATADDFSRPDQTFPPVLTELRLADFRCFSSLSLEPTPGVNFFLGRNATGKTSLLEAICVLLRLQSPRSPSLSRCVRFEQPGFGLAGHFGEHQLSLRLDGRGRKLALDAVPQSKSDAYLGTARITWFGNEDLALVKGPGSGRRRYLDFLGSQILPGYRKTLRSYERALRARNFLLRENRPRREIDAHSAPLLEAGATLHEQRLSLLPHLKSHLTEAVRDIVGEDETADLNFRPGFSGVFADALAESIQEDLRLRLTTTGPHRDDLLLHLNGMAAAEFGSEGQQRTLALALKLAQSRILQEQTGQPPVLLIDDIFGELDPIRRNRLLQKLPPGSQKFITTTFLDWHDAPGQSSQFLLENGKLLALP